MQMLMKQKLKTWLAAIANVGVHWRKALAKSLGKPRLPSAFSGENPFYSVIWTFHYI
ncbi:hypothetical protein JCM15908A_17260 [Prevotella dentasini JCM 15908]